MTNKERAEMMNLRKRVESQRSEIKRLTDEISRLREEAVISERGKNITHKPPVRNG